MSESTLDGTPAVQKITMTERELLDEMAAELATLRTRAETAERERDAWTETARQHCINEGYYRGIVISIGKLLGPEAFTCDDGSKSEDVLCAKVYEVLESQLSELRQAIGLLTTLHPTMEMDALHPLAMAQKIHAHCSAAERQVEEMRKGLGYLRVAICESEIQCANSTDEGECNTPVNCIFHGLLEHIDALLAAPTTAGRTDGSVWIGWKSLSES